MKKFNILIGMNKNESIIEFLSLPPIRYCIDEIDIKHYYRSNILYLKQYIYRLQSNI